MPSCDVCRVQVKRRINIRKRLALGINEYNTKLEYEQLKVNQWLLEHKMACRKCVEKLPKAVKVDCKPCARAVIKARRVKRSSELDIRPGEACKAMASCKKCVHKVKDKKTLYDVKRTMVLLKRWEKRCRQAT